MIDSDSPFNPALTGEDIADLTQGSLSLAGQVVLRSADPPQSSYTVAENRAFQAGVQVASIQSQIDWNDKEIDRLEQDVAILDRAVASGMTGPLGEERLAKSKELLAKTKTSQDVLNEASSQWQTVFNREGGTDEIQAHANTAVVKSPGLWFSALSMMAPNLPLMLKVAQAKSVAGEEGKDISSGEHRRLVGQAINSALWTGLLPLSAAGYGVAAKGVGRGVSALVSPVLGPGTVRTPGGLVIGKEILVHEVPEELAEAGFDYLSLGVVGGQGGWRDYFNPVSIAGQAVLFGGAQGLAGKPSSPRIDTAPPVATVIGGVGADADPWVQAELDRQDVELANLKAVNASLRAYLDKEITYEELESRFASIPPPTPPTPPTLSTMPATRSEAPIPPVPDAVERLRQELSEEQLEDIRRARALADPDDPVVRYEIETPRDVIDVTKSRPGGRGEPLPEQMPGYTEGLRKRLGIGDTSAPPWGSPEGFQPTLSGLVVPDRGGVALLEPPSAHLKLTADEDELLVADIDEFLKGARRDTELRGFQRRGSAEEFEARRTDRYGPEIAPGSRVTALDLIGSRRSAATTEEITPSGLAVPRGTMAAIQARLPAASPSGVLVVAPSDFRAESIVGPTSDPVPESILDSTAARSATAATPIDTTTPTFTTSLSQTLTPTLTQKPTPVAALDPTLAQKATPVAALASTPVAALDLTPVITLDPIPTLTQKPTPVAALDPNLAFAQGTTPTLAVDPTLALAVDPTLDPPLDPTLDPTVTVTPTRLRVGGKSLEEDLEEGVQPGEYASVVQVVTPPALVTTVLGSGEERAKALGTLSDIEVVATEPEPVIEASHEGRTAVIETGSRGRVRVRPIQETHYKPESHITHKPRIPKRNGLTPKPPRPPSTATPKPRGRKRGAAFTAAMRVRK